MSEWQPIATAPRDGTPLVLFAAADGFSSEVVAIGWHSPSDGWIEGTFHPNVPTRLNPTHWMPLPAPPEEVSDE